MIICTIKKDDSNFTFFANKVTKPLHVNAQLNFIKIKKLSFNPMWISKVFFSKIVKGCIVSYLKPILNQNFITDEI